MKKLLCLLLFTLAVFSVSAENDSFLTVRNTFYLILTQSTEDVPYVFAHGLGAGLEMGIGEVFSFEPSLDLYLNYFGFNSDGRPLPVEESNREIYLLFLVLDPNFIFHFPVSETIKFDLFASPSFFFPVPLRDWWDEGSERYDDVLGYLYGAFRFFQPMGGAAFVWNFSENTALEIRIKAYIPIFHLWDFEFLEFEDQMRIGLSLGFQFRL